MPGSFAYSGVFSNRGLSEALFVKSCNTLLEENCATQSLPSSITSGAVRALKLIINLVLPSAQLRSITSTSIPGFSFLKSLITESSTVRCPGSVQNWEKRRVLGLWVLLHEERKKNVRSRNENPIMSLRGVAKQRRSNLKFRFGSYFQDFRLPRLAKAGLAMTLL